MKCTMTLSNGRVLRDLDFFGNSFLSWEKLTRKDFEGGLSPVKIEGPDPEAMFGDDPRGTHERMELDCVYPIGPRWGFSLHDVVTPSPDSPEGLRADIDYLLMLNE